MRVAVVTGGGSGIGRAVSLRFAKDGTAVAVLDLNLAVAQTTAAAISDGGGTSLASVVDVADTASVLSAFETVRQELGAVSILVNSAGIANLSMLAQMTDEIWDRMIATHLRGTFLCCRAAATDMIASGWGRIINIASVAGLTGAPALTHYSAAKGGIIGFTKALAQEIGPNGITVNAVAPGMVDTPMLQGSGVPREMILASAERAPLRRIGQPEDIAAAVAFLASDEASFITGQVLSPNGGVYL